MYELEHATPFVRPTLFSPEFPQVCLVVFSNHLGPRRFARRPFRLRLRILALIWRAEDELHVFRASSKDCIDLYVRVVSQCWLTFFLFGNSQALGQLQGM